MEKFEKVTVDPSFWLQYMEGLFMIWSYGIFSSEDLYVIWTL
jgi:hypothetical protein